MEHPFAEGAMIDSAQLLHQPEALPARSATSPKRYQPEAPARNWRSTLLRPHSEVTSIQRVRRSLARLVLLP
jgi:hypothetical protein